MFLLATTNAHKVEEIQRILPDLHFIFLSNLTEDWDVEETGATFEENALIKAKAAALYFGMRTVADDSGLEIQALQGFPGIESARFMAGSSYREKMEALLEKMRRFTNPEHRKARFRTVAAFFDPWSGDHFHVEGIVEGTLGTEIRGEAGFGYDPLFIPKGFEQSFGELPAEIKNRFSHRARAFRAIEEEFKARGNIQR